MQVVTCKLRVGSRANSRGVCVSFRCGGRAAEPGQDGDDDEGGMGGIQAGRQSKSTRPLLLLLLRERAYQKR